MLTVAVDRSCSDGVAIRYVCVWMTSCFHIIDTMARHSRNCVDSDQILFNEKYRQLATSTHCGLRTGGEVCSLLFTFAWIVID